MDRLELENLNDFAIFARQLKTLIARFNYIEEIYVLAESKQLKHLDLWRNAIIDWSPIEELVEVEFLCLRSNMVGLFRFLKPLAQLRILQLDDVGMDDKNLNELVGFLVDKPNLESLSICANNFHKIEPLEHLKQLKELYLYENRLTQEQVAELQQKLPHCTIEFKEREEYLC